MRYIRTKDGIYEDAGTDALGWRCVRYKGNKIVLSKDDDKIVKEADTIEELCDEFVEVYKTLRNGIFEKPYFDVVSKQVRNGSPVGNLFGAIWTEWGLEYVAKMNDKGELELL